MKEDLFKMIGLFFAVLFLVYLAVKGMKLHFQVVEGLTNKSATENKKTDSYGEAGDASGYAAAIKARSIQIQDGLLIDKYRSDYENVLINMDDHLNLLALKEALNLKKDGPEHHEGIARINAYHNARTNLNHSMKFLDSQ
uniref:Uncharacterized protein n=1 Tax=viral metagenome TaxID=1070528 RepID=A0A6C0F478_9ZZZZ